MGYAELTKRKAGRVIGIDCSTNSLAYAVFDNGEPVECGEVFFDGADVYERLNSAREKTQELVDKGILVGDYVCIEAAIMMKSSQVAIKLAYVYGAVLSVLMQNDIKVETVAPITWQSSIGNKNLTRDEKAKIREDNPGQKDSWYTNYGRKMRKQRTLDFAKQYFEIESNSDNIGDAVGIGFYVSEVLTRR